jgi:hypothetical protein
VDIYVPSVGVDAIYISSAPSTPQPGYSPQYSLD